MKLKNRKNYYIHSNKAFSLTELLVTLAIIGVLVSIGVVSYNTYFLRARQNNAKYELSSIYQSELNFKKMYDSYHANLVVIGASPTGVFDYNAGFSVKGLKTGGDIIKYPFPDVLDIEVCTNYQDICKGLCQTEMLAKYEKDDAYQNSIKNHNRKCDFLSSPVSLDTSCKAEANSFLACAKGESIGEGFLTINEDKQFNMLH